MNIVNLLPTNLVKQYSYLDDNVPDKLIKIAALDAQDQMLQPLIGTSLFDKLCTDVKDATLAEPYISLLTEKIYPYLIQATLYRLYGYLLYKLTNSSIVKDNNSNSVSISASELASLKQDRQLAVNFHAEKLKRYLEYNSSTFPEYETVDATGYARADEVQSVNFFYMSDQDMLDVDYSSYDSYSKTF